MLEDLSQTPCVMSSLEVLQSYTSHRKALLTTLGSTETCNPGTIMLDTTDLKPHLHYYIAFQILLSYPMKTFTRNIFHMVVDEGASTCVMLLACCKAIGQIILVSVTYSSYRFRWSFIPTTWHHPLFPRAVRGEYFVRRGRSSQHIPRLQSLVR